MLPNEADVIQPMSDFLKKRNSMELGRTSKKNIFRMKKLLLTKSSLLTFYDLTKLSVVAADNGSYNLGSTLYQVIGKRKPIAFALLILIAERNYDQIEKEFLAAAWAGEKFDWHTHTRLLINFMCKYLFQPWRERERERREREREREMWTTIDKWRHSKDFEKSK